MAPQRLSHCLHSGIRNSPGTIIQHGRYHVFIFWWACNTAQGIRGSWPGPSYPQWWEGSLVDIYLKWARIPTSPSGTDVCKEVLDSMLVGEVEPWDTPREVMRVGSNCIPICFLSSSNRDGLVVSILFTNPVDEGSNPVTIYSNFSVIFSVQEFQSPKLSRWELMGIKPRTFAYKANTVTSQPRQLLSFWNGFGSN